MKRRLVVRMFVLAAAALAVTPPDSGCSVPYCGCCPALAASGVSGDVTVTLVTLVRAVSRLSVTQQPSTARARRQLAALAPNTP